MSTYDQQDEDQEEFRDEGLGGLIVVVVLLLLVIAAIGSALIADRHEPPKTPAAPETHQRP